MDWIHCNSCNCLIGEPMNRRFVLTNCGHLYCVICNTEEMKECVVCHREFSVIYIQPDMPKEMEMYFLNPAKTIKKQLDILEFQQLHRDKLFKCLKEKSLKYDAIKEENKRHREEKNKLKDELLAKCGEIRQLKKEVADYQQKLSQRSMAQTNLASQSNNNASTGFGALFNKRSPSFSNLPFTMKTPKNSSVPRPSSAIFANTSSSSPLDAENVFTPPQVSFQKTFRNCNSMTPSSDFGGRHSSSLFNSPSSSEPRSVPRKVLLPGDKGSSPANRIGLHRLNLTPSVHRLGSSPVVKPSSKIPRATISPGNKYGKYF